MEPLTVPGQGGEPPRKLKDGKAHPRLGINAQRSCTDCPVLFVFLVAWAAMIFVANLGFSNGKPARLLRGTDYMADICGVGDMAAKPVLWYPFGFNSKTGDFIIKDALKMGLCVSECPSVGGSVTVYGDQAGVTMPQSWLVLVNSVPKYHRCFPNFGTFDCSTGTSNTTECELSLGKANNTWASMSHFNSVMEDGFNEVKEAWWIILASVGIVIVLSYFWLFILRRLVKPMVIISAALVLIALIGLGALFWHIKTLKENLEPPQEETAEYYKYGAITAWVVAFIYLCVLIFLWKDLMTACDIIEEATKVPLAIPTMVLVPPVGLLAVIPFAVWALIVAVYIQSSGDKVSFNVPFAELFNSSAVGTVVNNTGISSNVTSALTREYQWSNWRLYAHLYNLFVFLWSYGFIGAICYMTLAMCGVYWYWSNPGDDKTPPEDSVRRAAKTVLRYHLGTVALGSLLVAIIQMMRVVLAVVEQRMKDVGERTDAAKCVFKVLQCCLAYLERVVNFINKNGYIMCAMQGSSFIQSARDALSLLTANALSVGAVTIISEYVMTIGKVLVTLVTLICTYYIIQAADQTDGLSGGWVILLIVMILAFLISCLFAAVFSVCIDTVLLCYCFDLEEDGDDYYPTDLAKHVSAATLEKGKNMKQMQHDQELQQRLTAQKA